MLEPGSTVVFYTDGLVERRTQPLDEGFAWLAEQLRDGHLLDADALSDRLLAALGPVEDDVALLILRVSAP